jgi:hypothetical protein
MGDIVYYLEDSQIKRDREVGERIYNENKHKPIRRMGPMDYSAGQVRAVPFDNAISEAEKAKRARKALAARAVRFLREHGAKNTQEIAAALHVGSRAVACALAEVPGIQKEAGKDCRNHSRAVLWMMPVWEQ